MKLCQTEYIFYFILILYYKHDGMSSTTKIKVIKVAKVLIITFNRKSCSYNVFYLTKS